MNDEIADTLVSSVRLCQFVDKLSVNYSELLYFANVFRERLNSILSNKLFFNFITISHSARKLSKQSNLSACPSPSDKTSPSGWWKVVISKETLLAHQSVTFFSKSESPKLAHEAIHAVFPAAMTPSDDNSTLSNGGVKTFPILSRVDFLLKSNIEFSVLLEATNKSVGRVACSRFRRLSINSENDS